MKFDFESIHERLGTDSQKWQKYAGRDIIPLWIADMDFQAPPRVIEALHKRIDHGIFGYAKPTASTTEAIVSAMKKNYDWKIDPSWIVWLPGLVCGLNVMASAFAAETEEVLSLTPVYPPFTTAPKYQNRVAVNVPLKLQNPGPEGRWTIDWIALEKAITPKTKVFYFCSPHNPIAQVWNKSELTDLVSFCAKHNLVLCSDDIHCDLILNPNQKHLPVASLSQEAADLTVTFMAPSKTYNIPGLATAYAIIPNVTLRTTFIKACAGIVAEVTALGYTACETAYREGESWRLEMLEILRKNRETLVTFIRDEIPKIHIEAPIEATYLAWLNIENLKLENPIAYFESHGIGLSDGAPFGEAPGKHVRLNFGCPEKTLIKALNRLKLAVEALPKV
jgi:cystathionine beta-lyase